MDKVNKISDLQNQTPKTFYAIKVAQRKARELGGQGE